MAARSPNQLPRVVKLLAINGAIGGAVGCSAAGGLLATDAGGLATLFAQSGRGTQLTAAGLLFGGFALTFASLAMASAVMLMPRK